MTTSAYNSESPEKVNNERLQKWNKEKENYWLIHGEYYDMRPFIERHPGGETFILLGKGKNCTELFESVHCLSKINVHNILAKYKVERPEGIPKEEELYTWKEDGFYRTVVKRVREKFNIDSKDKKPTYFKANFTYWFKTISLITLWFACVYYALFSGSLIAAAIAGCIIEMLGFCIMHDGSHGALFKQGWKNIFLMSIWNLWMFWCPWIWLRHHTYAHHSFTGVHSRDPDINNSKALIRKHEKTKWKKFYTTQGKHFILFLMLFPNQHFGQSIQYFVTMLRYSSGAKRSRIFGLPLEYLPKFWQRISFVVFLVSFFAHFVAPFFLVPGGKFAAFLVIFVYWACLGTSYFMNVAPNHETIETHETMQNKEDMDWGAQQVLSSANHSGSGNLWSTLVTHLWGGMNFQIEHHLFPGVCHVHYPEISKIVQKTANEFGVKYVSLTWWGAMFQYQQMLEYFSTRAPQQKKVD